MKRTLFLVTLFCGVLLVSSASAENKVNANIGKHLYRSYCLVCHGQDAKGDGPLAKKGGLNPVDLTTLKYQKKNIDELVKIIGFYGRKDGSKMPNWKEALPESNIRHLAAYIKRLKRQSLKLSGNQRRGREIYKSACISCHGTHGKGDGVLANLMGVEMIDYTKKATNKKISDRQLIAVIHDGKGDFMPAWDGTLNDNEINDVAAYVRSLGR